MIVDLGKYAVPVLSAYGVSIAVLVLMIWQSLARSTKVKRALSEYEKSRKTDA